MQANKGYDRPGQTGFTLLELVSVLIVLGILGMVLSVGMRTGASVSAEAEVLRTHLRYAQSLAVANNIYDWSVAFDGGGYILQRDNQPSPVPWPGENSPNHRLPAEVALAQGAGVLAFDAWGVPPADYAVVLSDGERNQQVDVLAVTGLIP